MTDADRIYRERERQARQAHQRAQHAKAREEIERADELIIEVRERVGRVLGLLARSGFEQGELKKVSLIRRTMFGRSSRKEERVAVWLLDTIERRAQDGVVQVDCWLTSRGRIAVGPRGWATDEIELSNTNPIAQQWLPAVRDGLEAWEKRLSSE